MKPLLFLFLLASSCTPFITKNVQAIQPSQAVDTPAVWVEVTTNDESTNGIYRCTDDGKQVPTCKKAAMTK